MAKYARLLSVLLLGAVALGLGATGRADGDDPIPFDVAMVFFELNNGTGQPVDLGLHIKADGESWRFLKITGPGGTQILDLQNKGQFRKTGGSEFFIEGAEPPISEVPIAETLAKFLAGTYVFAGKTVEGQNMRSEATLTHVVPDAPEIVSVIKGPPFVITWNGVTARHPDFPNPTGSITIVAYQVIVGSFQVTVPHTGPGAHTMTLPPQFVATLGPGEHGFEVLAIEEGGNQTITEGSFTLP
jgi:hypothetical protein